MIWPFENDTSKVVKKLAVADLKAHKLKTFLSGVVILTATCLLATVVMFLFNNEMSQVESSPYHAMYSAVDNNTKNVLMNNDSFSKVGIYKYFGGSVEKNGRTDIAYMDTNVMELLGYQLVEGNMPVAQNEVLVSYAYLQNHNLKDSLGSRITFSYIDTLTNKRVEKEFTLAGIIKNPGQEKEKQFYIITSDTYRLKIALQAGNMIVSNFSSQRPDNVDVLVRLNNEKSKLSKHAKKEFLQKLGIDLGIKKYNIILNYQYIDGIMLESNQLVMLIVITLFIMFASSFVIYSIFSISIVDSTHTYAQMTSLGITAAQLKQFLKVQGNILIRCFVPLGVILSLLITSLLTSTKWFMYDVIIVFVVSLLIAAVIKLSLKKPTKILISISPIEAMKYTNAVDTKKRKTIKNITPVCLAKNSLNINRKRNRMAVISLSISGILIIAMAILISSINLKRIMLQYYPLNEDFMIGIHLDNYYERFPQFAQNNPFSDELIAKVNSIVGVDKVVKNESAIGTILEPKILDSDGKQIMNTISSISPELLSNAGKVVEGTISYNALGNDGIILNQYCIDHSTYGYDNIRVGDTMKFNIVSGDNLVEKEFRVVGIAYFQETSLFYTSKKNIESLTPYNGTTHISIFCQSQNYKAVKTALENVISQNPDLILKVYEEEYSTVENWMDIVIWSIYGICLFLVLFGILNMINILITSAIIRKREFALLQVVGMTRKQLRQMLYREGMGISVKSVIISAVLGIIAGKGLCYFIYEVMSLKIVEFHLSAWPIFFFAVLLIGIQIIISTLICRNIEKDTLTERLRNE